MIDLETVSNALDEAYYNALQECFAMYFANNFPGDEEHHTVSFRGTLDNVTELTESYDRLKTALQQQNLQGLHAYRRA